MRVLSIGDAQLDVFLELAEAEVLKAGGINKLCVTFADKLRLASVHSSVAGNACNAAICFARLGLESYFLTIHGDDRTGEEIEAKLTRERVKPDFVQTEPNTPSSYSAVLNYGGERTQLVYYYPRNYRLPGDLSRFDWVYVSQVGKRFEPVFKDIVEYVDRAGTKLVFNPTNDQLDGSYDRYRDMIKRAYVLSVNKEEGVKLAKAKAAANSKIKNFQLDIKGLMEKIQALGPKIVVVTDGEAGSYCFDGQRFFRMPIFQVKTVEKTGAGDGYTAAFAAGLILGQKTEEAMRWGALNAAGVVTKYGPQEGLLRRDELERLLGENAEFRAREF